ncbi:MAG: cob(I)yrinic acid a,c-diamide adenosyltransferase [Armatimonadetes bacterium]|nr:cob(I)yrinic acid a,c-diamide adenosyltransferase [Armatimonadota bacterium]
MPNRLPQGMIHVYTGDGKGKTSAALGLTWRAVGAGLRVAFFQFLKGGMTTSELNVLARFGPAVWLKRFAPAVTPFSLGQGPPNDEDRRNVAVAWSTARAAILSGRWDVVVLDEINNVLRAGLLDVKDVLATLRARPSHVEVVCTGRGAPAELIDAADLVTDMRMVKHPYNDGLEAREGIEF